MTRTKMIARIVAGQRCQAARAAATANKSGPSKEKKATKTRSGVKNIEGIILGRGFKIKMLLAQQRNIDVKKWFSCS